MTAADMKMLTRKEATERSANVKTAKKNQKWNYHKEHNTNSTEAVLNLKNCTRNFKFFQLKEE